LDFSLFTDGLKAEREQNITIDVAYRYFSTPRRKFIIADTPGHEQYTRNMATGASTAQLMLILVDASKGLLPQSRRHAFIASLLGIQHIVLVVNKMDLVDYSEDPFERICAEFDDFAARLQAHEVTYIPTCATRGDNVVTHSGQMPWYQGTTLLNHLETVHVASDINLIDLRFPVQYVSRPDQSFRGYMGTVTSGIIRPGDEIVVLPGRLRSRVKMLIGGDGPVDEAFAPQACCVVLADDIDVSRGCMLVRPANQPEVASRFDAMLVWMSRQELKAGRPYDIKHTTRSALAEVATLHYRVNVEDLHRQPADTLAMNEIGRCTIEVNQPLAVDPYQRSRATGSFILIDRVTHETVAAGMILERPMRDGEVVRCGDGETGRRGEGEGSSFSRDSEAAKRTQVSAPVDVQSSPIKLLRQRGGVLWFTGLSGSGKSTVGQALHRRLTELGHLATVLDGDVIRKGLNSDLGFSRTDRAENIRRIAEVAALLAESGLLAITTFISPYRADRERARSSIGQSRFIEIYLDVPLDVCRQRDPKGLYRKAADGRVKQFTGVSDPYEPPLRPGMILQTHCRSVEQCVEQIVERLREKRWIWE
jgi:bifunctional enzyme CysN/CysC